MRPMAESCPIIILAAGTSSRLGQPKQLLEWRNKTLLRHAVDAALETGSNQVSVVLGAFYERISPTLNGLPVTILINQHWQEGMASSIRCGILHLLSHSPLTEELIIMLADQPFISAAHLGKLIEKRRTAQVAIAASSYSNQAGTPALFHQTVFPLLLELKGEMGARKILASNTQLVTTIDFPEGVTDVDTEEDYEKLTN